MLDAGALCGNGSCYNESLDKDLPDGARMYTLLKLKLDLADDVRERLEELARFRGKSLTETTGDVLSTGLFLEEGLARSPKLFPTAVRRMGDDGQRSKAPTRVPARDPGASRKAAKGG